MGAADKDVALIYTPVCGLEDLESDETENSEAPLSGGESSGLLDGPAIEQPPVEYRRGGYRKWIEQSCIQQRNDDTISGETFAGPREAVEVKDNIQETDPVKGLLFC